MRLLEVNSLALEEFFEPNVPKYAILSHTWEEGEILFEDIRKINQARKKPGFKKVQRACNLAQSQGYEYIWIDTCCIDKSSSAELTEAINSMYRWYQKSDVCYAFLSDVSEYSASLLSPKDLGGSRWFTRGWTLQELLAPDNVQFYCAEWTSLGNKKEDPLCSTISEITTIDQTILRGKDIADISIARRMYWASGRQTTRIEDRAYSLLGIFGIYMPLIYGEGHKAFQRLQEEILKTTDDQSIFAWHNGGLEGDPVDVLARTPSDFAESGPVSPYTPFRANRKATSITNQGIVVELPILSVPHPLHTEHSPFEEIEAILDCQLGSAPGTFPTIRLRSVERGRVNAQRHYYRIMAGEGMTKVDNHNNLDLISGDVIGFDPTKLDRDIYKSAIERLNWSWKVETIIITRHIPKPRGKHNITQIPWSLSLLASEYPPDDTPFWLALFSSERYGVYIEGVHPKERWDESLRQMRVSPLPKTIFGQGHVCRVEGIFDIKIRDYEFTETKIVMQASLIVGRKSYSRRDPYLRPWCRVEIPPVKAENYMNDYNDRNISVYPTLPDEEHPDSAQVETYRVKLNARVRVMEVSGRFYYMVSVYALSHDRGYNAGLRLLD
ncbi:heterokaryon incompatibility protein-domain-containing protein [Xylaria grammica]|nr:heterokaryon incompatibility protein-domain-containing protein [Xylaria grammica]